MTLHLLYFGVLKEFFEADRDLVEPPDDSTVADLIALLRDGAADMPVWNSLAVAVNREYASLESPLHDGDEVALLPPVSGGASCA